MKEKLLKIEDDIPLVELAKRMKCQKDSVNPHLSNNDSQIKNVDYNDKLPSDKNSYHSAGDSDDTMCDNEAVKPLKSVRKKHERKFSKDKDSNVKQLLRLISNML